MKLKVVALFALLIHTACTASAQDIDKIGIFNLSSQRISGEESVVVKGDAPFVRLSILVTVGVDGKVLEARVSQNLDKADPRPALAAAREWIFRPQFFDGRPVQAVGTVYISYEVPEIPADPSVPFPRGRLNDTEIELRRGACLGTCPAYTVSISGDGTVRFSTGLDSDELKPFSSEDVVWAGKHIAKVDPQAVSALVQQFRAAHFMGLRNDYTADVDDLPAYSLTLRVGKATKRVIDYWGRAAGMPANVTVLEDGVDALARTDRWVRGNAETIALLKAQGFDFKSKEAALMVLNVIRLNNWSTDRTDVNDLISLAIAEGLDLSVLVTNFDSLEDLQETIPIGVVIAKYAARSGNESLFEEMMRRGQAARMSKNDLNEAFHAGAGCSTKIAKGLVAAGANINAHMKRGNALHAAVRFGYWPCDGAETDRRIETVRTLIDLGTPLEGRNDNGQSPLIACDNPDAVQILLEAGADPNARDAKGKPAILSTFDDRVAILLLRAGADPLAKGSDGTLADRARELHWPATLAWLESRGIH